MKLNPFGGLPTAHKKFPSKKYSSFGLPTIAMMMDFTHTNLSCAITTHWKLIAGEEHCD
jgi:hypothetical protein